MNNVLQNLQVTTWYKAIMVVSAPAFLIVLATQRDALALIFAGAFLIGLGEWKNHPKKEAEYRPTVTGHVALITDIPHKWTVLGTAFQLLGVALLACGAYLLLGFTLPQSK
jgi:hypothetical protein